MSRSTTHGLVAMTLRCALLGRLVIGALGVSVPDTARSESRSTHAVDSPHADGTSDLFANRDLEAAGRPEPTTVIHGAQAVLALSRHGDNPSGPGFSVASGLLAFELASDSAAVAPVVPEPHGKKRVLFAPHTAARCDFFFITEFSTSRVFMDVQDQFDAYLFTNSVGLMKNVDEHWALGSSLDVHLAKGHLKYAPTIRYKHWLKRDRSVEVSLGYVPDDGPGLIGPIGNVRYSPLRTYYVQGGVCQYKEEHYSYAYYNNDTPRTHYEAYGGMGFAGVSGIVCWGLQAAGVVVLAILFSGME